MSSFSTSTQSIEMLALGCFDGLHLGHKELLKRLNPENSALFIIDKAQNDRLTPKEILQKICEFPCFFVDFESIKNLAAEQFLAALRRDFVNLKALVVGEDFRFGKARSAGALDIKGLCGLEAIIVKDYEFKGISVHSKIIKESLKNGDLKKANALLGREFSVFGELIRGQGLGKKAFVPTLNLDTKNYFLPKNGVWASVCRVWDFGDENDFFVAGGFENACKVGGFENGFKNGQKLREFNSVSFLGLRSTDGKFSVETHILDSDFDEKFLEKLAKNDALKGENFSDKSEFGKSEIFDKNGEKNSRFNAQNAPKIELVFKEFLRENQHFDDLSALKKQILRDCENAAKALRKVL